MSNKSVLFLGALSDIAKSTIQKFGENATKSGATLKGIFEKAMGKKGKK